MLVVELLVAAVLTEALASLRGDARLADDLFEGVPGQTEAEARRFLLDPRQAIAIELGYPVRPPTVPQLNVVAGDEREGETPIGLATGLSRAEPAGTAPLRYVDVRGTWFYGVWQVLALHPNAYGATWLHAFAKWALLRARDVLDVQGLKEQQLAADALRPVEQWLPDVCYQRLLVVEGRYLATAQVLFTDVVQRVQVQMMSSP